MGVVVDTATGAGIQGVTIAVVEGAAQTLTDSAGRFVLVNVPPGARALRAERLGYRTVVLEDVIVRTGRVTEVRIVLSTAPVEIEGVRAEAERIRLIEPDVSTTHDIVLGRELRELPVDRVAEAIELAPGVSGGHFRGGRIGQEVYVVDGLETKNQLEGSSQGFGLEFAPTSLEEVEVVTGGFGAQYGSALSGVVSYVTRRGSTERWEGRLATSSDGWAPASLYRGFTMVSLSAGGPLRFMGGGATMFGDLYLEGSEDADPRARGLTCLGAADAEPALAQRIRELESEAPGLRCPWTGDMLPQQRGDRLIGFLRFDRRLGAEATLTISALRNRTQRELYSPAYRYHPTNALGQRTVGSLLAATAEWTRQGTERAWHGVTRIAVSRTDRHLGAVDPWTFDGRARIGTLGLGDFRFLGEDFVERPIEDQLSSGAAVPGYAEPGGVSSPFGLAGRNLFFTSGTPDIANRARSDLFAADLSGEMLTPSGGGVRGGFGARLYRVESYERVFAHLPGSSPSYARFFPATLSAFTEAAIAGTDDIMIHAGLRVEAFRSGLSFRRDRGDFLSPVLEPGWRTALMPRLGLAMPVPGTEGRGALRFNWGWVAQPPDFRYFLDSTIGDSLRTDIRRQGNPELSFERGRSYEAGASYLVSDNIGAAVTLFRKELTNLVSGSLRLGDSGAQQYTTGDFGTVQGLEVSMRAQWRGVVARAGYALQSAKGVASGAEGDTLVAPGSARLEYPLAFDRRHSIDVALFGGRAAGDSEAQWSAALVASAQSGYPIDRYAAGGVNAEHLAQARLPWTATIDLAASHDIADMPWCGACTLRATVDARNLLGRANVVALRRDTGLLAPSLEAVEALVDDVPPPAEPIPRESPSYSALADTDGDGLITADEFRRARFAAVLDRFDPSLFYGEPGQIRIGLELTFR